MSPGTLINLSAEQILTLLGVAKPYHNVVALVATLVAAAGWAFTLLTRKLDWLRWTIWFIMVTLLVAWITLGHAVPMMLILLYAGGITALGVMLWLSMSGRW